MNFLEWSIHNEMRLCRRCQKNATMGGSDMCPQCRDEVRQKVLEVSKGQWAVSGRADNPPTTYTVTLDDPEGWWSAWCKWDGCIQFHRYYNEELFREGRDPEDVDNIHLCDLDETIERLSRLRDALKVYFGERWPDTI